MTDLDAAHRNADVQPVEEEVFVEDVLVLLRPIHQRDEAPAVLALVIVVLRARHFVCMHLML